MKHLDQNNILSPFQHGFRLRHSCETRDQQIVTVHDLSKGIDQHLQTDLVLLDFTKAFDSVPHQRLSNSSIQELTDVLFAGFRISFAIVHRPQLSGAPDPLPAMSFPESLKDLSWGLYCFYSILTTCPMVFPPIFVFLLMIVCCTFNFSPTSLLLSSNLTLTNCLWQLRFNPAKCFVMHTSRKRTPLITDYFLYNTRLAVTKTHPYLGIEISDDLR